MQALIRVLSFVQILASPTGLSFGKRYFSSSARSNEGEHVPRSPLAKDLGFHASEVPNFTKYTSKATESGSKGFSYFMIGTMGLMTAAGAKSLVSDFLKNMSASADVLALAKVEVDMGTIPEGKNVIIKVCCCTAFHHERPILTFQW